MNNILHKNQQNLLNENIYDNININNNIDNNINNIDIGNINHDINKDNYIEKTDNYSISSLKNDNIKNDTNFQNPLNNIEEQKLIIESKTNNLIDQTEQFNSKLESENEAAKQNIQYNSPENINNLFNNLNINSSIKTNQSYYIYNSPDNLYNENIDSSPVPKPRQISEYIPFRNNNSIKEYKPEENGYPQDINNININSSYKENKISNNYRPITQFEQYNQPKQFAKVNKLNINNQEELNYIKKSKSFDNNNIIPKIYSQYNNENNMDNYNDYNVMNNEDNEDNNINKSFNNNPFKNEFNNDINIGYENEISIDKENKL